MLNLYSYFPKTALHRLRTGSALLLLAFQASAASVAMSPSEIVGRAEDVLWGKTAVGEFEMTISTPTWTRSLSLHVWMDRPNRSFLRITAPAKDAGITSLRIKSEMWNYLPAIERTIKIPPSLMLQPWLGSDFSNDDLVKESSIVTDYNHRLLDETDGANADLYRIEGLPKPDAPIVWGKIINVIRKDDFVPVKLEYYDERGNLVRELNYSDVRPIEGRMVPTRWEMHSISKPGKKTTLIVKSLSYNKPLSDDIFSLGNLKQKD